MPAFFVLAIVVVIGMAIYGQVSKARRRDALSQMARQLGLRPVDNLPFALDQLGFHLFTLGDGSDVANVLAGTWQGLSVFELDYEYYEESTDSEGRTSRSYSRFSVVLAELGVTVPFVRLEPETLLTRLADHLAMHDIEFESDQFNRTYNVSSAQREFAFKLIDARMMEHLLGLGAGASYEVGGSWVLAYSRRLSPEAVAGLLAKAKGFVDHVPELVWNEYRRAAS